MRPFVYWLAPVIAVGFAFLPVEISMAPRRALAEYLYAKEYDDAAMTVYNSLIFNGDLVASANNVALQFRLFQGKKNTSDDEKHQIWVDFERTQDALTDISPIGAYNLAMPWAANGDNQPRHIYFMRKLREAASLGDAFAKKIIGTDTGDISRFDISKRVADLSDPVAQYAYGSNLHSEQNSKAEEIAFHRKAAEAGIRAAMSELGWLLINRSDPQYPEAEKWIRLAAARGDVMAANRLGGCLSRVFYFCKTQNNEEAAKWYQVAISDPAPELPPRYEMENGVIRVWFGYNHDAWYPPINHKESAAKGLAELRALGFGVKPENN